MSKCAVLGVLGRVDLRIMVIPEVTQFEKED